jgi:signal transduction histidine kinase
MSTVTDVKGDPVGPPLRLLIADDTAEVRQLLRMSFDLMDGFDVVAEADNGHDAVEQVVSLLPDLVILDLAMPQMDGFQAIAAIRSRAPATKIIVLSGFSGAELRDQALSLGADRFVEKGQPVSVIAQIIRDLCGAPVPAPAEEPVTATLPEPDIDDSEGTVEELMSFMIHELRTPMMVIRGYAETLEEHIERLDQKTIVRSAGSIVRGVMQLNALIQSFADARAVQRGQLVLIKAPTDLSELVQESVSDLGPLLGEHRIHVDAGGPLDAAVDAVRIRQVLSNLVANAANFSPHGSVIAIDAEALGGQARITVTDQGPGIPDDRHHELFQKFARLGAQSPGTGLGLFISQGIARAHGGELSYQAGPAGGARFTLALPLG